MYHVRYMTGLNLIQNYIELRTNPEPKWFRACFRVQRPNRRNMKINRKWHEKNRMPKNPSLEQRIRWHLEHSKDCACRPIPQRLLTEIEKRSE